MLSWPAWYSRSIATWAAETGYCVAHQAHVVDRLSRRCIEYHPRGRGLEARQYYLMAALLPVSSSSSSGCERAT